MPAVITVDDAATRPDAIGEMFAGTLRGVVVRAVLPPAALAEAVRRLDAGVVTLPRVTVPVFKGFLLGMPLVASPGLEAYLDAAAQFRAGCAQLFGALDVEARVLTAMARLAGGRGVSVPRRGDARFLWGGLRVLIDGDALPFHYENSTFDNPCMAPLLAEIDRTTLMSFYVAVAAARGGGELRLYDVDCAGANSRLIERLGGNAAARPWFEAQPCAAPPLAVGDLIVFDGGRHYHEVTPVSGGPRWTLGGFLALTTDHRAVRVWS